MRGVLAFCLLVLAGSASAQQTGTLITRQPAQTDIRDKGAARQMLQGYARCVVDRSPGSARSMLDLPVDAPKAEKMFERMTGGVEGDDCMAMGGLSFPMALMRGAMFEALYRRDYGRVDAAAIAASPAYDYARGYDTTIPSAEARQAVAMGRFADCVVRADPATAIRLISTTSTTSSEDEALKALTPKIGPCLASGQTFEFSKSTIRAAVAEALYRRAQMAGAAK